MKGGLTLLLSLYLCGIYSQALTTFNGSLNVVSAVAGDGPNEFIIGGFFNNTTGAYASDSCLVGDYIMIENGDACALLVVDTINSKTGGFLNLDVTDLNGDVPAPPYGIFGIYRPAPSRGYPMYIDGVNPVINGCILRHFALLADTVAGGGGGGSTAFDWARPIQRQWYNGLNIGGTDIVDGLEWLFFAPPTLSLNVLPSQTVWEVGDSTQIVYSGAATNPSSAVLSNGYLRQITPSLDTIHSFGVGPGYSHAIQFAPQKDSTGQFKEFAYSFQAKIDWVGPAESGTATSTTRTLTAVYPVLVGVSNTDYSVGGNGYIDGGFSKLVEVEGDKTASLTGSGYIYYFMPSTWADTDLTIFDHNDFNVTPSFDRITGITVTSTGLTNNWSQDYVMYKLQTTTVLSANEYKFNQ